MLDYTTHRSTAYFRTYQDARTVRDAMRRQYHECRIVGYGRGYAVQRERSGPYLNADQLTPGGFSFTDRGES